MAYDSEAPSADVMALQRARDRIERGWTQGRVWQNGNVCMAGAFVNPKEDGRYLCRKWREADRVAALLGFGSYSYMTAWNDASERTVAQVLARFDAAIERAAAGC